MKKVNLFVIILTLAIFLPMGFVSAASLCERLSGKILLQVESDGEAWYVEPGTKQRAFLGRPADAFRIMRELGLGVSEANYNVFTASVPEKFSGKILLRVEANGEAYYVNPEDMKMHYLGRPADAFEVMRNLGLGITNDDLGGIEVHSKYQNQIQEQNQEQEGKEEDQQVESEEETTTEEETVIEEEEVTEEETTTEEEVVEDPSAGSGQGDIATTTGGTMQVPPSLGKQCEFTADYYRNYDLTGKIAIKKEMGIDHDWGDGKPDEVYKADRFSVRWTGNCEFEEGRYRFFGTFNDAVKATLDNSTWIHNYWVNNTNGITFEKELDISAGRHFIKVDYYDYLGDAVAQFDWEKVE